MKELIHQTLRERIVFGEISPGERLVEADLATRFGVSKTPVREALLTLEGEGLVVLRAHRGGEVSRLSAEEYRDLQYTRDALEFGAMPDIVAALDDARIREVEQHLADMEATYASGDYKPYRRAQRRLHLAIVSAAASPTLTEIAINLQDRMDRYAWLAANARREWWEGDLRANRNRVELLRRRDADGMIAMLKEWHRVGLLHIQEEVH